MSSAQKMISSDSLIFNLGNYVKVCDQVESTFVTEKASTVILNMGRKYPDQKFEIVIFSSNLSNFPFKPEVEYNEKRICVTGIGTLYKEKPQMVVKFPDQIAVEI